GGWKTRSMNAFRLQIEAGLSPPHTGWLYVESSVGDRTSRCESCGTRIKNLHRIEHPTWDPHKTGRAFRLTVGAECGKHILKGQALGKLLLATARVPKKWASTWGLHSQNGLLWRRIGGKALFVIQEGTHWIARVKDRRSGAYERTKGGFASREAAVEGAFYLYT